MIDFHSHIVYDVDDGSETLESSINILKEAEKAGFDQIILTPHYWEDYYDVKKSGIKRKIEELQRVCYEQNINIKLYQANEIYISNDIVDILKENKATTINESDYVLFEVPLRGEPLNLLEVVYKLKENGNIPILAHPERYEFVQKDPNKLIELIEEGVLLQANYGSIIGQYGESTTKTLKQLLENNFIHFFGSDVHKMGHIYQEMPKVKEELIKIIPEEKIEELSVTNIEKVLNNKEIEIEIPTRIKTTSIFSKLFKKI